MTRAQTDIDAEMAEAVDWLVRLQGETVTERDWLDFDAWLTASPAHAQAYDAVLTFDDRLNLDSRLVQAEPAAEPLSASAGKVVPLRPARRVWIWSAGAAIAAAVAGVILLPASGLLGAHETTYVTGVGERRTVALEDGSRIEMNAASRMTVRFERHARRVHLDDAQAFFDVAKDECLARNRRREGKARVPDVAIHVSRARLQPPTREEGFDALHIVRAEGGEFEIREG